MLPAPNPHAHTQGYTQGQYPLPILLCGQNQQERIQNFREAAPNRQPYERLSWNRTSAGQHNKPPSPPPPPPPIPAPYLTLPDILEQTTNTEPQNTSSFFNLYA